MNCTYRCKRILLIMPRPKFLSLLLLLLMLLLRIQMTVISQTIVKSCDVSSDRSLPLNRNLQQSKSPQIRHAPYIKPPQNP